MKWSWSFDWERWKREHRWDKLGQYNAERGRGLVHTPEWQARMAEEQTRFNEEQGRPDPRAAGGPMILATAAALEADR